MAEVLVLGSNGMLGHMVLAWLRSRGVEAVGTTRSGEEGTLAFTAGSESVAELLTHAGSPSVVVNAIGIIKPRIKDTDAASVENAIRINALFPHELASATHAIGTRVIQIATDCVYSGATGSYIEAAAHDPLDVYGKTKSLGEVSADHVLHLRCSIIGPEAGRSTSLLEWFRQQPQQASVTGFANHNWNGVTTLQFARVCEGLIRKSEFSGGLQHLVPGNQVSKYELLQLMAKAYHRQDIQIARGEASVFVDRTIGTSQPDANAALWLQAGYEAPPSIEEMLMECSRFSPAG